MSARIIYRGLIALAVFLPLRLFNVADPFLTVLLSFQLCQLAFQICDGFFSMAYLLLNFALLLFSFPFVFQIAVIRNLSDPLPDCSCDFVEAALDLVFRAGFHIFSFSRWVLAKRGYRLWGCHSCIQDTTTPVALSLVVGQSRPTTLSSTRWPFVP